MAKRNKFWQKLDDITEAGGCLLTCAVGVAAGVLVSSAAYAVAMAYLGPVSAIVSGFVAFPIGFILGALAYEFRWLLRSFFE